MCVFVEYQAFMAHTAGFKENMEERTAQTEQKYAIW